MLSGLKNFWACGGRGTWDRTSSPTTRRLERWGTRERWSRHWCSRGEAGLGSYLWGISCPQSSPPPPNCNCLLVLDSLLVLPALRPHSHRHGAHSVPGREGDDGRDAGGHPQWPNHGGELALAQMVRSCARPRPRHGGTGMCGCSASAAVPCTVWGPHCCEGVQTALRVATGPLLRCRRIVGA